MRETGAVSKKYIDPESVKYIPRARTILGQLKARIGAANSGWDRQVLEDGTAVFVATSYGQDIISIDPPAGGEPGTQPCENFLESGWAYLESFTEHYVYLTPGIQSLASGSMEFLDYVSIGGDSLTFKLDSKRPDDGTSYEDGMPQLPTSAAEGWRGSQVDYPGHSALPGKLRAWYQAQLGCDMPDARLTDLVDGPNRGTVDYGLYSGDGFRYWLIAIVGTRVWAAEVALTDCGSAIRLWAKDHITPKLDRPTATGTSVNVTALRAARVEQYIFAETTGVVVDGLGNEVWTEIADFGDIEGSPFFYGFNFNWLGTEARMVTHERVMDGETPMHLKARRYTLSLNSTNVLTSASAIEEDLGNWTPEFNGENVWHIAGPEGNERWLMEFWYPCDCCVEWGSGYIEGDVVVYETYADDGEVLLAEHHRSTVPGVGSLGAYRDAWKISKYTCGSSSGSFEVYAFASIAKGFVVKKGGNVIADHIRSSGGTGLRYEYSAVVTATSGIGPACTDATQNYSLLCQFPAYPPSADSCQTQGCGGSGNYAFNNTCGTVTGFVDQFWISGSSSQSFLLLPFHSCEAFWVVSTAAKTGSTDYTTLDSYGLVAGESMSAYKPPLLDCTFSTFDGPYQLETPRVLFAPPNIRCGGDINNDVDASGPGTFHEFKHDIIFPSKLESGDYVHTEVEYAVNDVVEDVPETLGYQYLVDPTVCGVNPYPYYALAIEVNHSALERAAFVTGDLQTGTAGWWTNTNIPVAIGQRGLWEGIA